MKNKIERKWSTVMAICFSRVLRRHRMTPPMAAPSVSCLTGSCKGPKSHRIPVQLCLERRLQLTCATRIFFYGKGGATSHHLAISIKPPPPSPRRGCLRERVDTQIALEWFCCWRRKRMSCINLNHNHGHLPIFACKERSQAAVRSRSNPCRPMSDDDAFVPPSRAGRSGLTALFRSGAHAAALFFC